MRCQSCGSEVEAKGRYHTGFNDTGFLYCDRDSTVLTFGAYDKKFEELVGDKVIPWELDEDQKHRIASNLVGCPCGGRFSFANPLRCPRCKGVLSAPMSPRGIYFVQIDKRLDSEKTRIWKD